MPFAPWENTHKANKNYDIYIPGWKDIIHLRSHYHFNEQEMAEWKKPSKKRDYSVFTEDGMNEIKRRRELARRLAKSPTPAWARKLQRIVTQIDNVEDAVSTGVGIAEIATVVQPEFAEATVPAIIAGDVADTIMDVADAALSLPLGPMGVKRAISFLADASTFNMEGIFKVGRTLNKIQHALEEAKHFGAWRGIKEIGNLWHWFGKFIEAAQVSDQFFGVGISLGPIMGAISDSMFGIARYMGGSKVYVHMPDRLDDAARKLYKKYPIALKFREGSGFSEYPAAAFRAYASACEVLTSDIPITGEDMLYALMALNLVSQPISYFMQGLDWDQTFDDILKLDSKPVGPIHDDTKGILELEGIDPNVSQKPPIQAQIENPTVVDEIIQAADVQPKRCYDILNRYELAPQSILSKYIINSHIQFMPGLMGQDDKTLEKHPNIQVFAVEQLARKRIYPDLETDENKKKFMDLLKWMISIYEVNGNWPNRDEIIYYATYSLGLQIWRQQKLCLGFCAELYNAIKSVEGT